ncbi:MAG: hypothetical protein IJP96_05695 [Synergistaceae bacterium]|nr:hypothetical protein [Synergistaceae bacterium]MBR0075227.1 hypothetical protein [Synergistaceae bacterium]
MSTVTLEKGTFVEIEPEMLKQAEDILSRKGISYPDAVRFFTEEIILRKDVPEFKEVGKLPLPCIEDLTHEELVAEFEKGMKDIQEGRCHTSEEVRAMMEEHYAKF